MNKIPFEIITGSGLGTSYSSLAQAGSLWPAEQFGLMGMKLNFNITNGNVVIEDRPVVSMEYDVPQEIKFIYNSKADSAQNAWQLAVKKIKRFPSSDNNTATIVSEDGHESSYTFDQASNTYLGPTFVSGTPYLSFDKVNNYWVVFDQTNQSQEIYDTSGNLIRKIDSAGRITNFEYTNGQLSAVTGPSGNRYEIRRDGQLYAIFLGSGSSGVKLQSYSFDDSGLATSLPDGKQVKYTYVKANNSYDYQRIGSISQSDGSLLNIDYTSVNNQFYPSSVRATGTGVNSTFRLNFANPAQVVVNSSDGASAKFLLDQQGRIAETDITNGLYVSSGFDVKKYIYNKNNQLQQILYPDGSSEIFSYDFPEGSLEKKLGLLKTKTLRDGRVTSFYYDTTQPLKAPLIAHSVKSSLTAKDESVTRKVYDYNFDGQGRYHVFLRFEISPLGTVTENSPLADGSIGTRRVYTSASMSQVISMPPGAVITVNDVLKWKNDNKVNPQDVSLIKFQYNRRGQTLETNRFANIDSSGNGIVDEEMSLEYTNWDSQGGLIESSFKQLPGQESDFPTTNNTFDLLHRPSSTINALDEIISVDYNDALATTTTTFPNGRNEVVIKDAQGLRIHEVVQADGINRNKTFERDANGIVYRIINPDNTYDFPLYDLQNRLCFTVTTTGCVTQNIFNAINRFTQTIVYENQIDLSTIIPPGEVSPVVSMLEDELDSDPDFAPEFRRSSYQFFDLNGRLQYEVDAENYLKEYRHDKFDNVCQTIAYASPITAENLQLLLNAKPVSLMPDVTRDRVTQLYYDNADRLIGKKDAAGYVTEYILDAAGRTIETIEYQQPKPGLDAVNDFAGARPNKSSDDAHYYKFYNAKNQVTVEVNAKGYLTHREYFPCGLPAKTTSFITPVESSWYLNPRIVPALPTPSPEDRFVLNNYDALNRDVLTLHSSGKANAKKYDNMGDVVSDHTYDASVAPAASGDASRLNEKMYDGFGQLTAETNPYVSQLILEVELSNLPPVEKQLEIVAIWANASNRHLYDGTGLKLKTLNSLSNPTYFYYDQERRPCLEIGPTGIVKESYYNATNEVYLTIVYANVIDTTGLTGGFLTDDISSLLDKLRDPANDHVESTTFDHRGLTQTSIDAENNVTTLSRNAFAEVTQQIIPLNGQQVITINREYDLRGKETRTTTIGGQLTKIVRREFKNFKAKITKLTNAAGEVGLWLYDKLGNTSTAIKKALNPGEKDNVHKYEQDAFNRVTMDTNSLNDITLYSFNQAARSTTTILPEANTGNTVVTNIFNEVISRTDGLGDTQKITHTPTGQVEVSTDELNRSIVNEFNSEGLVTATITPNHSATESIYNNANQLTEKVVDESGLALTSKFIPNAFGVNEVAVDPRGIITLNTFNKLNKLAESLQDPSDDGYQGLNILSSHQYNSQSVETDLIHGDTTTPDQWHLTSLVDSLNRPVGTVLDPGKLEIQNKSILDNLDRTIATVDANQQVVYTFYDSLGNKRFVVEPTGAVSEWVYNAEQQNTKEVTYLNTIDVSKISTGSTIAELQSRLTTSLLDSNCYHYFDKNGREKYTLDIAMVPEEKLIQAVVKERQYSKANLDIRTLRFADFIDATNVDNFTTESLDTLLQSHRQSINNRTSYSCLDAAGQARFLFDNNKGVIEQRFDAMGNIIATIAYANPAAHPENLYQLTPEQVSTLIVRDAENDRSKFQIFDSANRLQFLVNAEGAVTRFDRNANGQVETECHFGTLITAPSDYQDLKNLLESMEINPAIDRVSRREYDAAGNQIKTTDSLGNIDSFKFDAVGNEFEHTDKNNQIWDTRFDRAQRPYLNTDPARDVTNVVLVNNKLTKAEIPAAAIVTHKDFDLSGNVTTLTAAMGTASERQLTSGYTPLNEIQSTKIANVSIDDVTKPASFDQRPEKTVDITNTIVRDARNLEIASMNDAGFWTYTVRNSLGQIAYELVPVDAVTYQVKQYKLNAFGDVITNTNLAKTITIPADQFTTSGVPYAWLISQISYDTQNDRNINYTRDHKGHVTRMQFDEMNYHYVENDESINAKGKPTVRITYNAFDEEIAREMLQHSNTWSLARTWYNRNGKQVATYQANGLVTTQKLNAFDELELEVEYAGQLENPPAITTSFSSLAQDVSKIVNKQDRATLSERDLMGRVTRQTALNVAQFKVDHDSNGLPELKDAPPVHIITGINTYSPTGKLTSTTYANGSRKCWYYDSCDNLIAEAGPARTTFDANRNKIVLTPLIIYGIDAHNKPIAITQYASGVTGTLDPAVFPTFIPSAQDQTTLKLLDTQRGLLTCNQDPQGNLKAYTNTASKQTARTWNNLSQWTPDTSGRTEQVLDEYRIAVDARDRVTQKSILRNNILIELTQSIFNVFDEVMQQDPGKGLWDITVKNGKNGRPWFSNANKGVGTAYMYNLAGHETARIVSTIQGGAGLEEIEESQLPDLFNTATSPVAEIQLYLNKLDLANRVMDVIAPELAQLNPIQTIPLQIQVDDINGDSVLRCPLPQEFNVTATVITLTSTKNPSSRFDLPMVKKENDYLVDISSLPVDMYDYTIKFYLNGTSDNQLYDSTGTIQCAHSGNAVGHNVTVKVVNDNQLYLSGNVQGITQVQLLDEEDEIVATLPVSTSAQGPFVDLSGQATGRYTIQPLTNMNAPFAQSVEFTIYTDHAARFVYSREMLYSAALTVEDDVKGTLTLTVPDYLQGLTAKLTVVYHNFAGQEITEILTIVPDDNNLYQATFQHQVVTVLQMSVSLDYEDEWLPLYHLETPLPEEVDDFVVVDKKNLTSLNVTFRQHRQILILPLAQVDPQLKVIKFLNVSLDLLASWSSVPVTGIMNNSVVIDVTELPLGNYPFKINDNDPLQTFIISDGFEIYAGDSDVQKTTLSSVARHFVHDNWNNLTREINSLGHVTDSLFNHLNLMIQQQKPEVNVTLPNDAVIRSRPTTLKDFDSMGFMAGSMDENGNLSVYLNNEAGQRYSSALGDGTVVHVSGFDIFKNEILMWDASSGLTRRIFNLNNMVVFQAPPSWDGTTNARCLLFSYNETNSINSQTNGAGETTRSNHDGRRNIILRITPTGDLFSRNFDAMHQILVENNPVGSLSWVRNSFGIALSHTNLRGGITVYVFDYAGNLRGQSSWGGEHTASAYINSAMGWINVGHGTKYFTELYTAHVRTTPSQVLKFNFSKNRLMSVDDAAQQTITSYTYDTEDNVIGILIQKYDGTILRQQGSILDEAGREVQAFDTTVTVSKQLDAAGNRRIMVINIVDPLLPHAFSENIYNQYDSALRMVLQTDNQGRLELKYVNNLRTHEITPQSTTTLQYDRDRRFTGKLDGTVQALTLVLDDAQRTRTSILADNNGIRTDNTLKPGTSFIQHIEVRKRGNTNPDSSTQINNINCYGDSGDQKTILDNDQRKYIQSYNTYVTKDVLQQVGMTGHYHDKDGDGDNGFSGRYYDSNNSPNGVYYFKSQGDDGIKQFAVIQNTYSGRPFEKVIIAASIDGNIAYKTTRTKYLWSVSGQPLLSYVVKTKEFGQTEGYSIGGINDFTTGNLGGYAILRSFPKVSNKTKMGKMINELNDKMYAAEMDAMDNSGKLAARIQLVNPDYPPQMAAQVNVQPGDTWESIAAGQGDARSADDIAEANGNKILQPGDSVVIPALIDNWNAANNYPAYNTFMKAIIPALSPHYVGPVIHEHQSFLSIVIKVIVGVVISIVVPGLGSAIALSLGSLGFAVSEALVDAVLGGLFDAGAQGIEMAMGLQSRFSLAELAASAASAGTANYASQSLTNALEAAAFVNITTQLVAMKTGGQKGFDLRQLMTTITTTAVMRQSGLGNVGNKVTVEQSLHTVFNTFLTAAISGVINRKTPDLEELAADAIGTELGYMAGNRINSSLQPVYDQAKQHVAAEKVKQKANAQDEGIWRKDKQQAKQQEEQPVQKQKQRQQQQKASSQQSTAEIYQRLNATSSLFDPNVIRSYASDVFDSSYSNNLTADSQLNTDPGVFQNLENDLTSQNSWSASSAGSTASHLSHLSGDIAGESAARATAASAHMSSPVVDVMSAEAGYHQANHLSRIQSGIAKGMDVSAAVLKYTSKFFQYGAYGIDIGVKISEVKQAQPGQRTKTAVVKTSEFVGETAGSLGAEAIVFSALEVGAASMIAAPVAAIVVGSIAGYYTGRAALWGWNKAATYFESYDSSNTYSVTITRP